MNNGLDLMGVESYYQQVIKGVLIVRRPARSLDASPKTSGNRTRLIKAIGVIKGGNHMKTMLMTDNALALAAGMAAGAGQAVKIGAASTA